MTERLTAKGDPIPTDYLPPQKEMCATCPFRHGSEFSYLAGPLAKSALSEASRICHSTGESAVYGDTGLPILACRGSRDIQIQYFRALGVLAEASDECWERTYAEYKREMELCRPENNEDNG
jgi:hypothetical protein